jgi:hypothetical protein
MDLLEQIMVWLFAIGALSIVGYILQVRGRRPRLVGLCHFTFIGASLGFYAGLFVHAYSPDFKHWITNQSWLSFRIQLFLDSHISIPEFAPILGMVCGLALAVWIWHLGAQTKAT